MYISGVENLKKLLKKVEQILNYLFTFTSNIIYIDSK